MLHIHSIALRYIAESYRIKIIEIDDSVTSESTDFCSVKLNQKKSHNQIRTFLRYN